MQFEVKTIGMKLEKEQSELLNVKKLPRLKFAESYLQDVSLTLTSTEGSSIKASVSLHFSWGTYKQIECISYDFNSVIDELFDKMERTCRKEKEKRIKGYIIVTY